MKSNILYHYSVNDDNWNWMVFYHDLVKLIKAAKEFCLSFFSTILEIGSSKRCDKLLESTLEAVRDIVRQFKEQNQNLDVLILEYNFFCILLVVITCTYKKY